MAAVYSARFVGVQGLDGDHFVTVPVGVVHVIRDVDVYMAAGVLESLSYRLVAPGTQTVDWAVCDIDTTVVHQWRGRQVMNPGETWHVNGSGGVDITVSGYVLTLP